MRACLVLLALAASLAAAASVGAEAESRLEAAGAPIDLETSRGKVLLCAINYEQKENGPKIPSKRTAVTTDLRSLPLEKRYANQMNYLECLTAGRGKHARDRVRSVAGADSTDWGVTLAKHKDENKTEIECRNRRDEDIRVKLDVKGLNVEVTPSDSLTQVVNALDVVTLATVTPYDKFKNSSFAFTWLANPVKYRQPTAERSISSNDVFLVVKDEPERTSFSVINSREDKDVPVHFILSVSARPGTNATNLIVRDAKNRASPSSEFSASVMPGETAELGIVSVRDVSLPWAFAFNYRWQVGTSPKAIFGDYH